MAVAAQTEQVQHAASAERGPVARGERVDHAVDPERHGLRHALGEVAEVGVVLDMVAHQLAHRGDDRHGGVHRRVGVQCGQVVEQFTGCGEAHTEQHRVQLSGNGGTVAELARRGGHPQRALDDLGVEHGSLWQTATRTPTRRRGNGDSPSRKRRLAVAETETRRRGNGDSPSR